MNKAQDILVSSCLERIVREIKIYGGFIQHTGLMNGTAGICLLLYYYARYAADEETEAFSDWLLEELFETVGGNRSVDFSGGLSGIAWCIHHLMHRGFIQAENPDEILEDVDNAMWKEAECLADNTHLLEIGWYLQARTENTRYPEKWHARAAGWLYRVFDMIEQRPLSLPIASNRMLPVLFCLQNWQNIDELQPICEELPHRSALMLKNTYLQEKNDALRRSLMQQIIRNRRLNPMIDFIRLPAFSNSETPTFKEINTFYLYRLLTDDREPIPKEYKEGVIRMVSDTRTIEELLSLTNPENIGLENYVGGLALSMAYYCQRQAIHRNRKTKYNMKCPCTNVYRQMGIPSDLKK